MNKFISREQGLCYVKGHDIGGTVEPRLFIERDLNAAGGGCEFYPAGEGLNNDCVEKVGVCYFSASIANVQECTLLCEIGVNIVEK